ncbi:MAG TPA: DinB family protein [Nocardioides sp.]|jgi:hypothetical protein
MPTHVPPVANETEAIAGYLEKQQTAFRAAIYGLTAEQAALANAPGTLTVGGLVKHVAQVQEQWLSLVRSAADPSEDAIGFTDYAAYEAAFRFEPTDTVEAVVAAYDEVCARVLDAVRTIDLDTPVPVPEAPWFPDDVDAWSARWVWFHLLQELGRHAGHADIVREGIDGATSYELLAAVENWPETPWLKPWRPSARPSEVGA